MECPRTINKVQKLTGQIVALNRFMSKATDKCLPLFSILKKAHVWNEECDMAFSEFK